MSVSKVKSNNNDWPVNESKNDNDNLCIACGWNSIYTDINDTTKKYCTDCIETAKLSPLKETFYQFCAECLEHIGTSFTGKSGPGEGFFDETNNYYHSNCIHEKIKKEKRKHKVKDEDKNNNNEDDFVDLCDASECKPLKKPCNSSSSSSSSKVTLESSAINSFGSVNCPVCVDKIPFEKECDYKAVKMSCCEIVMHQVCKTNWEGISANCPMCNKYHANQTSSSSSSSSYSSSSSSKALESAETMKCTICYVDFSFEETGDDKPVSCSCFVIMHQKCKNELNAMMGINCPVCKRNSRTLINF